MSATVIIPTTGSPELKKAVESVLNQTYDDVTCYVVVDGSENYEKTLSVLDIDFLENDSVKICELPINVGANGFYGHRVYAAFSHLINSEYVLYLDQDNWFEPNHIESMITKIESDKLDWGYSLRNIVDKEGDYICQDNCESLGKWEAWTKCYHIDTNCYCIKTSVAIKLSQVWHGGWGQDRIWLQVLSQHFQNFDCTGEYTVNYKLAGNDGSVKPEFFMNWNKVVEKTFGGNYPWVK